MSHRRRDGERSPRPCLPLTPEWKAESFALVHAAADRLCGGRESLTTPRRLGHQMQIKPEKWAVTTLGAVSMTHDLLYS